MKRGKKKKIRGESGKEESKERRGRNHLIVNRASTRIRPFLYRNGCNEVWYARDSTQLIILRQPFVQPKQVSFLYVISATCSAFQNVKPTCHLIVIVTKLPSVSSPLFIHTSRMSDHEKLLQKRIEELEVELANEKAKNERSTIGRCKIEEMSGEVVDSNPYRSVS